MTEFTTSKDGTMIAFSRQGKGNPLILIDGAFCHRNFGANVKLPQYLTNHFMVYTYDRRGRGESGNTLPFSLEREFEDLQAVIDETSGDAFVYGISSGAALALEAVKYGVNIKKLVVFESPYIVDSSRNPFPANYLETIQSLLKENKPAKAVKYFMGTGIGLPPFVVWMMQLMPAWKQMKKIAHTLEYDTLLLKNYGSGEPFQNEDWQEVNIPVLVISGTKSEKWAQNAMKHLAEVLPDARHLDLEGQSHLVSPRVIAPHITNFLKDGVNE
ncbi:MAG: alpha/beta hydrolase [Cyclobacteriaceae bacterium]|nr:alpha/beta hydrolase [Cyclobacteriaceae bacterium]